MNETLVFLKYEQFFFSSVESEYVFIKIEINKEWNVIFKTSLFDIQYIYNSSCKFFIGRSTSETSLLLCCGVGRSCFF